MPPKGALAKKKKKSKGGGGSQRRAKGLKSSSSGAASAMLASQGMTGMIGFGAFAGGHAAFTPSLSSSALDTAPATIPDITTTAKAAVFTEFYEGEDSELRQNLKKAVKRDKVTRLRALKQLQTIFKDRPRPVLVAALPHFIYCFKILHKDNDRRVRESVVRTLGVLAVTIRKAFAKVIRKIALAWWCSMSDPAREVANTAKRAFYTTFPADESDKQAEVAAFCSVALVRGVAANLKLKEEDVRDPTDSRKGDTSQRHARLVGSSIRALSSLLLMASESHVSALLSGNAQLQDLLSKLVWKHCASSTPDIRESCYRLAYNMCTLTSVVPFVHTHLKAIAKPLLKGGFRDDAGVNQRSMWDAVLSVVHVATHASSGITSASSTAIFWESHLKSHRKSIFPALFQSARKGFYGSGTVAYPSMLPFLSLMPPSDSQLQIQLVENMWQGIDCESNRGAQFQNRHSLISAHHECLQYLAKRVAGGKAAAAEADFTTSAPQVDMTRQLLEIAMSAVRWALTSPKVNPSTVSYLGCRHLTFLCTHEMFAGDQSAWDLISGVVRGCEDNVHRLGQILSMMGRVSPASPSASTGTITTTTPLAPKVFVLAIETLAAKPLPSNYLRLYKLLSALTEHYSLTFLTHSSANMDVRDVWTFAVDSLVSEINAAYRQQHIKALQVRTLRPIIDLCTASMFGPSFDNWNVLLDVIMKQCRRYSSHTPQAVICEAIESAICVADTSTQLWSPLLHSMCDPWSCDPAKEDAEKASEVNEEWKARCDIFRACVSRGIVPASTVLLSFLEKCAHVLTEEVCRRVWASNCFDGLENHAIVTACSLVDATLANFAVLDVLEMGDERGTFARAFVARCALFLLVEKNEGVSQSKFYELCVSSAETSSWSQVRVQYERTVCAEIGTLLRQCQKGAPNTYLPSWSTLLSGFVYLLGTSDDPAWFSMVLDVSSIGVSVPITFSLTNFVALVDIMEAEGVMEVLLGSSNSETCARRVALVCDGLARCHAADTSGEDPLGKRVRTFYREMFAPEMEKAASNKTDEEREVFFVLLDSVLLLCLQGAMSSSSLRVFLDAIFSTKKKAADGSGDLPTSEDKVEAGGDRDNEINKAKAEEGGEEKRQVEPSEVTAEQKDPALVAAMELSRGVQPENTFRRGESVVYMRDPTQRKGEAAVVMRAHVDDEGSPYYTIRLSSGVEKQTEGPRLRPLIAAYRTSTTVRNDGTYDSSSGKSSGDLKQNRVNKTNAKGKRQKKSARAMRRKRKLSMWQAKAGDLVEAEKRAWMTTLNAIKIGLVQREALELRDESRAGLFFARTVQALGKCLESLQATRSNSGLQCFVAGSAHQACLEEVRNMVSSRVVSSEQYLELFAALHPESWSESFALDGEDLSEAQARFAKVVEQHIMCFKDGGTSEAAAGLMQLCASAIHTVPDFVSEIEVSTLVSRLPARSFDAFVESKHTDNNAVASVVAAGLLLLSCSTNGGEYFVEMLSRSTLICLLNLCRGATVANGEDAAGCDILWAAPSVRDAIDALASLLPWVKPNTRTKEDTEIILELLSFQNSTILQCGAQKVLFEKCHLALRDVDTREAPAGGGVSSAEYSSLREEATMVDGKQNADLEGWRLLPVGLRNCMVEKFGISIGVELGPDESMGGQVSSHTTKLTSVHITFWRVLCQVVKTSDSTRASKVAKFVSESGLMDVVLRKCFEVLCVIGSGTGGTGRKQRMVDTLTASAVQDPIAILRTAGLFTKVTHLQVLCAVAVFDTATTFPAMIRNWWIGLTRSENMSVGAYFERYMSPLVVRDEFSRLGSLNAVTASGEDPAAKDPFAEDDDGDDAAGVAGDGMHIRLDSVARAVVATYVKDDCHLEIGIELPRLFPLKQVKVTCRKRLGIKEERWRRWSLQIVTMLSKRDGSLLDGVQLWKRNVDREFEGVEPCPICYSVLHVTTHALPRVSCDTCHNRFHSACLYTWFKNSSKSTCPLCRSAF